jgi:hypothetical protein
MRGTLHLVTAEDYRALRPLLQPMLSASMPARAEVHGEEARTGLGAGAADIGWMVIREALAVTAAGMAIALPAAGWLSRLVASQLYGVRPSDPLSVAAAVALLGAVSILAGLLPSRRAARVEPTTALRYE